MNNRLRLLLVEDSEDDALLVLRELRRGGYQLIHQRVDTAAAMQLALEQHTWDLIIADYRMPQFSAPAALEVLQQQTLDLPFIIVSGTIGEDSAVAAMKAGAHDYLMKDNLTRLVPAVERELREAEERLQRRRAEQALRESEERFRSLIENAQDLIALLTNEGTIVYISPAVERILGYAAPSLIGQPLVNLVHERDQSLLSTTLTRVLNQAQIALTVECQVQHCQGHWRTLEVISKQFFDPQRYSSIVVNARDITERKQAEEIRQQLDQERQLRQLKVLFFSMMSHELKNPLGSILAAAELLEHYSSSTSSEKKQQFFQVIRSSIRQITDLLNDTLVLGQAEAGRLKFQPAPLDLEAFCRDMVSQLQFSTANQHAILFQASAAPLPLAQLPLVPLDQELLRHILGNLLSNALKYSPQDKPVYFRLHVELGPAKPMGDIPPPYAHFQIQDQGIGIPPEDQIRLFDTFHRASNVGRVPGTGLGLAIVKQCVDLHEGTITVVSNIGVGTTFTVVLPFPPQP